MLSTRSLNRTGGIKPSQYDYRSRESHMTPRMILDTGVHWSWRNPLNIIPAFVLFVTLLGLVAAAF